MSDWSPIPLKWKSLQLVDKNLTRFSPTLTRISDEHCLALLSALSNLVGKCALL